MPHDNFDLMDPPPPTRIDWWGRWMRAYGAQTTCGLGCLGFAAAIVLPVIFAARESGTKASCMSNLKQVGLGIQMYLQDFDETLMPRERWIDLTMPYLKNEGLFRCVDLQRTDPQGFGFAFNGLLSRKRIKDVPVPHRTPMVYDSDNLLRNAFDHVTSLPKPGRHHGGNNIGWVDGHVKWMRDSLPIVAFPKSEKQNDGAGY